LGNRKIGDTLTVDLFNDTWGGTQEGQNALDKAIKTLPKE